jgi:hypothetical protein
LDKKEIINFLRNTKIRYTDFESDNLLVIATLTDKIYLEALSKNNNFYNNISLTKYGLINLVHPDISVNDRYIAPYNKIIKSDTTALTNVAIQYNTNYVLLINLYKNQKLNNINIYIYNVLNSEIENIGKINILSNNEYKNDLLNMINNWWKNNNLINNSEINKSLCLIKSSNINDLKYINSKINSISQIKSNVIKSINYGNNLNNIVFFGNIYYLCI